MMRAIHRWISTVGMVTLFYLVVTGTILAIDEFVDRDTIKPVTAENAGPPKQAALPGEELATMTQTVLKAALTAMPQASVNAVRVRLQMQGDQPQGVVTFAGANSQTLTFNARTGEPIQAPSDNSRERGRETNFNNVLQEIHSGAIAGKIGQWIIIFTGLGFVFLSFTGIWMYFQLRGARAKRGRKEWFWDR